MPTKLKKMVRARMAETGGSYTTALRYVRAQETRPNAAGAGEPTYVAGKAKLKAKVNPDALAAFTGEGKPFHPDMLRTPRVEFEIDLDDEAKR